MSSENIDINELIGLLNAQIANQNLELHVAKLQIASLKKEIDRLSNAPGKSADENITKPKSR